MVSKEILAYLFGLLYQESGLVLDNSKEYLIETRLEPLAAQEGFKSIDAMGRHMITKKDLNFRQKVVDAMTTNETSFFRDRTPFDMMRQKVIPDIMKVKKGDKRLRIWSAACSTGQEPYSLAMVIREMPMMRDWKVEIVATDIKQDVLNRAEQGIYTQHEVQRGMASADLLRSFTQKGSDWHVKPVLKQMITFKRLNLLGNLSSIGEVDVVFCRNILIYFDAKTKSEVVNRITKRLAPHGALFLGGSEALFGVKTSLVRIGGATRGSYYQRPEAGSETGPTAGNTVRNRSSAIKGRSYARP